MRVAWAVAPAVLAAALLASPTQAADNHGVRLTESMAAHVEVDKCPDATNGPVRGRIVRLLDPKGADGRPVKPEDAVDHRKLDANLRTRTVLRMVFLYAFKPTSTANSSEGGAIYSAEDGETSLQADGTLRLRGYVGAPILGKTQIWTRVR